MRAMATIPRSPLSPGLKALGGAITNLEATVPDLENPMIAQHYTDFSGLLMSPPSTTQWHYGLACRANIYPDFSPLLCRFEPISLAQMDDVALLDRTDIKYVINVRQLYRALASLTEHYWVLDIDGIRLNHYQTLYFDTADFALYMRHHAGGGNRYKVRSREYVDTGQSFLEVKLKTNRGRTIKRRIQTLGLVTRFTPETNDFMNAHFPLDTQFLEPKLWNDFSRITLVSKRHRERLTLDLTLQFCSGGRAVVLPGIAIAEVKQDSVNRNSDFIRQMRAVNIRPTGFSKYCIGVSMLYQNVKHNNFKPRLRLVNKLMRGDNNVQRTH
jgi:hypothetical protein